MAKNNTQSENEKGEDFPKITIDTAIGYLNRIISRAEGDIVTHSEISKSIGKAGGNLARIIASLKQFGLLEKLDRPKEWKITSLGNRIVNDKSQADKLKAFLNPPIHTKIWSEYKQARPGGPALIGYLKRQGFGPKPAKKLSKLFLSSFDQFSMKTPLSLPKDNEAKKDLPKSEEASEEKIYLAYLIGSIFPSEDISQINKTLDEIIKISEGEDLDKLITFCESLKISLSGKEEENEINEELRKFAGQAKKIMKKELGIK